MYIRICNCGSEFEVNGLEGYNKILMCNACTQKRIEVIEAIKKAVWGLDVEYVAVALSLRNIVEYDALPCEAIFVRDEKLGDKQFKVVEHEL